MSSSNNIDDCMQSIEDDEEIQKWYRMAQTKLKKKITDNLEKRVVASAKAINMAFKNLCEEYSDHIWKAIHPNKPLSEFDDLFPVFTTPKRTRDTALEELLKKVDEWPGVDINAMNARPPHFKKYWTTSDNWWNRYKAEWIGDFFFYPLFQDALFEFVMKCTHPYDAKAYNDEVTSDERKEYEQHITRELFYFSALKQILYEEVSFQRARSQPLILDQAFVKSECTQQFFAYLGNQHGIDWAIPPNDKRNRNRLHVRQYARDWTNKVLQQKINLYKKEVMRLKVNPIPSLSDKDDKKDNDTNMADIIANSNMTMRNYNNRNRNISKYNNRNRNQNRNHNHNISRSNTLQRDVTMANNTNTNTNMSTNMNMHARNQSRQRSMTRPKKNTPTSTSIANTNLNTNRNMSMFTRTNISNPFLMSIPNPNPNPTNPPKPPTPITTSNLPPRLQRVNDIPPPIAPGSVTNPVLNALSNLNANANVNVNVNQSPVIPSLPGQVQYPMNQTVSIGNNGRVNKNTNPNTNTNTNPNLNFMLEQPPIGRANINMNRNKKPKTDRSPKPDPAQPIPPKPEFQAPQNINPELNAPVLGMNHNGDDHRMTERDNNHNHNRNINTNTRPQSQSNKGDDDTQTQFSSHSKHSNHSHHSHHSNHSSRSGSTYSSHTGSYISRANHNQSQSTGFTQNNTNTIVSGSGSSASATSFAESQSHSGASVHSASSESAGGHDIERMDRMDHIDPYTQQPSHMMLPPQVPNIPLYDAHGNLVYTPPAPYRPIRGRATTAHLTGMRSHPYSRYDHYDRYPSYYRAPIRNSTPRVYAPRIANTNMSMVPYSMHYGHDGHGHSGMGPMSIANVPFGAPTPTPTHSRSHPSQSHSRSPTSVPPHDNAHNHNHNHNHNIKIDVDDVQLMTAMDSQNMNNQLNPMNITQYSQNVPFTYDNGIPMNQRSFSKQGQNVNMGMPMIEKPAMTNNASFNSIDSREGSQSAVFENTQQLYAEEEDRSSYSAIGNAYDASNMSVAHTMNIHGINF